MRGVVREELSSLSVDVGVEQDLGEGGLGEWRIGGRERTWLTTGVLRPARRRASRSEIWKLLTPMLLTRPSFLRASNSLQDLAGSPFVRRGCCSMIRSASEHEREEGTNVDEVEVDGLDVELRGAVSFRGRRKEFPLDVRTQATR